jgi:TniQ
MKTSYCLLPVRPRPIAGEANLSYLARVTEANGYESIRQLWRALRAYGIFIEATDISEFERHYLFGPLPGYWGNESNIDRFAISDFNHSHLRWCPLCLMDSRHLRGVWSLKLYCVCTHHKIHLHEQCASCGDHQRLEHPNFNQCECGTRLTTGNIVAANPGLVRVTQALESSLSGQHYDLGLPSFTAPEWIRLATFLGQFSESYQPPRPGKMSSLYQLTTATNLISGLAHLLEDWPHNFHRLIRAIHQRGKSGSSLQRTFGSLYRVMYRQLKEPYFQFIRDAFEDYVHQHWDGIICKRNKSLKPNTIAAHPQLTIKQAAKKAGSGVSVIRHLMKAELISSHQSQSSSTGRTSRSINLNSVSKIAALTKNTVVLEEAAKILALPKRRVRLLIQAGIIKPLVSRKQVNAAVWRIPRVQLSQLWLKPRLILHDDSYITLVCILKHWRLSDDEFIALVEAIQNQQIICCAAFTQAIPIGKTYLNDRQFGEWLTGYRIEHSNSMTVDGAAKALGLKQQVAYQLVRTGLLQTNSTSGKGVRISTDELERFQASYVSLAELARIRGCSPRKLLLALPTKPVTGQAIDGNRQYFYLRSEVGLIC